jgi:alkylation response protein AidB-like acyl-CoA dehydrogenase
MGDTVLDLVAARAAEVERIAAVDGSTGWCAVIGGGGNVLGGYVPEIGAREIFADPDRPTATMFAPQGRIADGRLTGRWPFTSNCLRSDWIGLGALVDGVLRIVFVRAVDLRIEHTWDSAGLRGTGSAQAVGRGGDLDRGVDGVETGQRGAGLQDPGHRPLPHRRASAAARSARRGQPPAPRAQRRPGGPPAHPLRPPPPGPAGPDPRR